MGRPALAYLITWSCYAQRLHGDERGSVDREHRRYGTAFVPANPSRLASCRHRQAHGQYELDECRRTIVADAVVGVCRFRRWPLPALHVRSTHVHAVVVADVAPEAALNQFKAYASRALNDAGCDPPGRLRWARHGSTRWLFELAEVEQACRYVLDEQGPPMAVRIYEPTSPLRRFADRQRRDRQGTRTRRRTLPDGRGSRKGTSP